MKKYIKTHTYGPVTFYNAYIVADHTEPSFFAYEGMATIMQEELGVDPEEIMCGGINRGDDTWNLVAIHAQIDEPCPDRMDWIHLAPNAPLPEGSFGI